MKKHEYVRATLTLKPTREARTKMRKAKTTIRGPLTGTLVLRNWLYMPWPTLEVAGSLEPKTTLTKPKKTKAQRARKQKEQ